MNKIKDESFCRVMKSIGENRQAITGATPWGIYLGAYTHYYNSRMEANTRREKQLVPISFSSYMDRMGLNAVKEIFEVYLQNKDTYKYK